MLRLCAPTLFHPCQVLIEFLTFILFSKQWGNTLFSSASCSFQGHNMINKLTIHRADTFSAGPLSQVSRFLLKSITYSIAVQILPYLLVCLLIWNMTSFHLVYRMVMEGISYFLLQHLVLLYSLLSNKLLPSEAIWSFSHRAGEVSWITAILESSRRSPVDSISKCKGYVTSDDFIVFEFSTSFDMVINLPCL